MNTTMEELVKDGKTYKRVPKGDDHKCFGCSPANPHGLQMEFYHADDAVLHSWLVVPDHLRGWNDLVHGGVISTILDEIMSWTAISMLKKFELCGFFLGYPYNSRTKPLRQSATKIVKYGALRLCARYFRRVFRTAR